jgi:hypothetical protein
VVVACQAERGDDDVWDLVCLVEDLYGGSEGFEISNGCIRKQSVSMLAMAL